MSNQFDSLAVPAGNGTGASSSFINRHARTVAVAGAFAGILVIEGSVDDVEYHPIAQFSSGGFATIDLALPYLRVQRKSIESGQAPGAPVVTVGSEVELVSSAMLPPPVGLNGAGAAVDVSAFQLEGLVIAGDFSNPGMVVHVEISMDGVCWAACAAVTAGPVAVPINVSALYARQKIVGRDVAGPVPTVGVFGPTIPSCYADLPLPVLPLFNGPGAAIDTSECGADKTIIVGAPGGDVPCRIAVQGTNDGGVTWVVAQTWNTTGMRKLRAIFQEMRIEISGLAESVPGICVGVAAPQVLCEEVTEGNSTEEHSNADGMNEFAETVELTTPAGIADGDLLIVAIAITYQPHLLVSPAPPGDIPVIFPVIPGDWQVVLADYPDGINLYNFGEFEEEDRLAVFRRVVQDAATEPATHEFTWAAGGGPTSFVAVIKNWTTSIPNASPFVVDAPATGLNSTASAGNPGDCPTPGNTALEDNEILLGFFMARNGLNPAPGGTPFTIPVGMADLSTPVNLQTSGVADPLGLAMFVEIVPAGAVGVRTSTCDITDAPPTPFRGAGYSILIAGCPLPQPPPPT